MFTLNHHTTEFSTQRFVGLVLFILVRLMRGWREPLWYQVTSSNISQLFCGALVNVPFRATLAPAIVVGMQATHPQNASFEIRQTEVSLAMPKDRLYQPFAQQASRFYRVDPAHFYQRIFMCMTGAMKEKDEEIFEPENLQLTENVNFSDSSDVCLTDEQTVVVDALIPVIKNPQFHPVLVHGVTGSGKTEIYKRLIMQTIEQGKTVIFLLPEISLCLQFERIFKNQLPATTLIYSFHSLTLKSERLALWKALAQDKPVLIIGVHQPIFLPCSNLGCIIIDEEHETGFSEKRSPHVNSKEVALMRAQMYKIPIILGSATPSVTSLYQAEQKKWAYFRLEKRFSGTFPTMVHATLKGGKKRKHFWITPQLDEQIQNCLFRGEQAIIYLNRRGYSFCAQCCECGASLNCPHCSVSLTVHEVKDSGQYRLECHYCGYATQLPPGCPECKQSKESLIMKGIGTQQMTALLKKVYPQARIVRADLDSTKEKRKWAETLREFGEGNIDILVGTQLVTKGYHFPKVTLVGVVWADLHLAIPKFNARESLFQKLIQVAGRAGRSSRASTVIVQTMSDDDITQYLDERKYMDLYREELEVRQVAHYPPCGRFFQIELRNKNDAELEFESRKIAQTLRERSQKLSTPVTILGPVKPTIYCISNINIRHIFIKSPTFAAIDAVLSGVDIKRLKSSITFIPTP